MSYSSTIKPIETFYKGCRFRSRLEARWAVFFDNVNIKWKYEHQGFEFKPGEVLIKYLPDFYLEKWNLWVEIKPKKVMSLSDYFSCISQDDEVSLMKPLVFANHKPQKSWLAIFTGEPWIEVTETKDILDTEPQYSIGLFRNGIEDCKWGVTFMECPVCKEISLWKSHYWEDWQRGEMKFATCCSVLERNWENVKRVFLSNRLMNAYIDARSARFELYPAK